MQPFSIFRAGKHKAANGESHEFSEDHVQQAIDHYDPAVSEAPIVVGHPRDNGPAYGWVGGLARNEQGEMVATPRQLHDDFAEMVAAGRFKNRSASFYKPDAPNNPVPGVFYLRHVGFLGAQPPAVKGLSGLEFSEDEEGVVELAEPRAIAQILSGTLKRMREFFIDQYDTETADRVIPAYVPEDLDMEARLPDPGDAPEAALDEFTDSTSGDGGTEAVATGEETNPDEVISMSEAEQKELAELRAAEAKRATREQIQPHVDAGRITPALADSAAEFAASLDADEQVEFGEGDSQVKATKREHFLTMLGQLPQAIEYGEAAADAGEATVDYGDTTLSQRARAYQTAHNVSFTVAIDAVAAGKDKAGDK